MAFNTKVWDVNGEKLEEIPQSKLDAEKRLENWIENNPDLINMDILFIGRQVRTAYGDIIDLLAIDPDGDLVVIELKKSKTPRTVVAQLLDYASWVNELGLADIEQIAEGYLNKPLSQAFSEHFDTLLPDTINTDHKMLIVASELDDASERITQYLSSKHSLNINAIFFNFFTKDGKEMLTRSWLIDPEQVEERGQTKKRKPWKGFYYVNVGDNETNDRKWEDCAKYGFLRAGGGPQWSRPLKKLKEGDRIFAYLKGHGYVGFGHISQEAKPLKDFIADGQSEHLIELIDLHKTTVNQLDDPDKQEWAIGVKWHKDNKRENARNFKGIFSHPSIVCKLRDDATVKYLCQEFQVENQDNEVS
ncbi:MAG: endonuclease NucS domain-containing protein [Planctomycetota bacterium]|jgi:hypothetical protein